MAKPATPLTRKALHQAVWSRPMATVARELGVSGGGLSKLCDRLLIPYPQAGYWARARTGASEPPPALPPAPEGEETIHLTAGSPSKSRRARTRLSPEERRDQLIDAAAELIAAEGLAAATMKTVARHAGISEAQARNYFPRRGDLLLALARRELEAMNSNRRLEISRGRDRKSRVTNSTVTYLREVAERGALIQVLTSSAEVREGLREERRQARGWSNGRVAADISDHYRIPRQIASAATTVLTSVVLRAGRLLAGGKLSLASAERLAVAITTAGNRDLARTYRLGD